VFCFLACFLPCLIAVRPPHLLSHPMTPCMNRAAWGLWASPCGWGTLVQSQGYIPDQNPRPVEAGSRKRAPAWVACLWGFPP
jgi:hypothetical protein